MIQSASVLGALLILAAYAAHQAGYMGRESLLYHLLNAAGAVVLCVVAIDLFQVGFIVLEGVWAAISLGALVRTVLRRPSGA
jgi:hypothetical protein